MRAPITVAAAAVSLFTLVSAARAQSILEIAAGIKFCKTLTDDAQRLKCFDGLFSQKPVEAGAEKTEPAPQDWTVTEGKSPIDDSPQVAASLTTDDVTIVLRCKEKKTEAIVGATGLYFPASERVKVITRINEGKSLETSWSPSTAGNGAFAPSAVEFIRALPENGQLFVRIFGYSGRSTDGLFRLGLVSQIRTKIATACHWKVD